MDENPRTGDRRPSPGRLLDLNDRLGTPEDFATTHLPQVLARFAQAYPAVQLEVTCDLTLTLLGRFRQGDFDLVLVKREPERSGRGVRVWREPLVWVAGPVHQQSHRQPQHSAEPGQLPLALSPPARRLHDHIVRSLESVGG